MKRTKKIKLVLISAALASCNRMVVPQQEAGNYYPSDSTLSASLVYSEDSCLAEYAPAYLPYPELWNYSFNVFGFYYNGTPGKNYYMAKQYKGTPVRRGRRGIVRGGWGRSGKSVSSAS